LVSLPSLPHLFASRDHRRQHKHGSRCQDDSRGSGTGCSSLDCSRSAATGTAGIWTQMMTTSTPCRPRSHGPCRSRRHGRSRNLSSAHSPSSGRGRPSGSGRTSCRSGDDGHSSSDNSSDSDDGSGRRRGWPQRRSPPRAPLDVDSVQSMTAAPATGALGTAPRLTHLARTAGGGAGAARLSQRRRRLFALGRLV